MGSRAFASKTFKAIASVANGSEVVSWEDIVAGVKAANIAVANWLDVRGILQFAVNEGLLVRTENLHVEEYKVLGSPEQFALYR